VRALEHGGFGGKEQIGGQVSAVDVVLAEGGVGLGDAYELNLRVRREAVEEALDVAVDEADDRDADGWCCLSGCGVRSEGEGGKQQRGNSKSGAKRSDHTRLILEIGVVV
jgi:hypothetical protein